MTSRRCCAALTVLAVVLYPRIGVELLPQADEGEVTVNAELGVGTRIELTEKALLQLEQMVETLVPEKSAESPEAIGSFQRWSSADWRGRTVAVR